MIIEKLVPTRYKNNNQYSGKLKVVSHSYFLFYLKKRSRNRELFLYSVFAYTWKKQLPQKQLRLSLNAVDFPAITHYNNV